MQRASPRAGPSTLTLSRQLFTLETPFPRIAHDTAVLLKVRDGGRPYKPSGLERVGFSEDLWDAMQRGWSADTRARPPLSAFSAW
jgi:hypothetical protein